MGLSKAVILAAGGGQRLGHLARGMPKGFIRLGEETIIEESIKKILLLGIKEILIVTGFMDSFYERLKEKFNSITTVKNEKFAKSGTMYSLFCARNFIDSNFLLLESDLIFETRGLVEIVKYPQENCLLLSGRTQGEDEVYVEGAEGRVSKISKDSNCLENVVGEFVGISKISFSLFKKMIQASQDKFESTLQVDYDMDCISGIAKENDIFYKKIDDLLWAEIDNESQLLRAIKIYDKILAKSPNTYPDNGIINLSQ